MGRNTYLFPNINGWFDPALNWAYDYLSMQGLKLIHVSKRAPGDTSICRWSWSIFSPDDTKPFPKTPPDTNYEIYLSHPYHPLWDDFYVFNSFMPRLPQQLLPLMSKPFELNLRYLGQRIYRSGEMYWMTLTQGHGCGMISKNLLVCRIN